MAVDLLEPACAWECRRPEPGCGTVVVSDGPTVLDTIYVVLKLQAELLRP